MSCHAGRVHSHEGGRACVVSAPPAGLAQSRYLDARARCCSGRLCRGRPRGPDGLAGTLPRGVAHLADLPLSSVGGVD